MDNYRKLFMRYACGAILVLVFTGIGGFALVRDSLENSRASTKALWSQISVGDDQTKVRSLLGVPKNEYEAQKAPVDYYVPGYGHKVREISGRVLIYFGKLDLILYVYFDTGGRVEETVVATS